MIGKKILHYKIHEKLGEGGMGIVYLAEDTKLNRQVAIKMLPPHLLVSAEDKTRFQREAKAAAALNHANISTVYEINEHEGTPLIVMEYVEGQTLNHHIEKGPLKLPDAISIAFQVAEGLKAAHNKDIIHRDIKSSNIILGPDKQAKILDFGLAKTSMSTKLTQMGSTIGTVAYMSPEQVKGKEVDSRTDLWSLGVVMYEMICGRLPFAADYDPAIFYAIENDEPEPLTAVRAGVPMALEWIVSKLLAKDPTERYQNGQDLIIDLKAVDVHATGMSRITKKTTVKQRAIPRQAKRGLTLPWIIATLSFISMLMVSGYMFLNSNGSTKPPQRFNITGISNRTQQYVSTDVPFFDLSPDSRHFVYCLSSEGVSNLYIRSFNSFEVHRLEGSDNANAPFFSPDGQWIGFVANGKLKKVSRDGSHVEILADAPGFRGADWGPGDKIIYAPSYASGLMAVSAKGGEIQTVTSLDSVKRERTHRWPQILPDGKHVLYTIGDIDNPNSYATAFIAIQSLEDGSRTILDVRAEMARYIEPGYMIIARNGALFAAPFSLSDFRFLAQFTPVLNDIDGESGSGISYFSLSEYGDLIYVTGTRDEDRELVWVDRQGKVELLPVGKRPFNVPRVSPDGKMIAVNIGNSGAFNDDIWMYDINKSSFNRFTFGDGNLMPVWRRDGKGIYFASEQSGYASIRFKSIDGQSGQTLHEFSTAFTQYPCAISPDNRYLILNRVGGANEGDLLQIDLRNSADPEHIFQTPVFEYGADISPDGNYMAYGANETGRLEIFIRTYPEEQGKWQVSTHGGIAPRWAPDGRELFYINSVGKFMSVPIQRKPFFSPGKPKELFDVDQMNFPITPVTNFDVAPDGQKFIMIRNSGFRTRDQAFNIVTNWLAEVEERLSENK